MILTDETELSISNVNEAEPKTGSVRAFIKVKLADGSYQTIIPITNSGSVLSTSGKSLDVEIEEIIENIGLNGSAIQALYDDTGSLSADMVSLVDYVNPLMEQLKSHMEVVDLGNEVESTIFDHIYSEIDTMVSKITSMEQSISDIITKLNKVVSDNANLSKTVESLSSKLSSHEDTIV